MVFRGHRIGIIRARWNLIFKFPGYPVKDRASNFVEEISFHVSIQFIQLISGLQMQDGPEISIQELFDRVFDSQ